MFEAHGVTISTRQLPSVLNLWAERLSRRRESTTWGLSDTSTALLIRLFKLQELDGSGMPTKAAGIHDPMPLVAPLPDILPVWHCHLQGLGYGVLVGPV